MLSQKYDVRVPDVTDADNILSFCKENEKYYECCGEQPTMDLILHDIVSMSPGVDISDKYCLGFFMVKNAVQGKEIGTGIIQDLCTYLKQINRTCIQLAVAEDDPRANLF